MFFASSCFFRCKTCRAFAQYGMYLTGFLKAAAWVLYRRKSVFKQYQTKIQRSETQQRSVHNFVKPSLSCLRCEKWSEYSVYLCKLYDFIYSISEYLILSRGLFLSSITNTNGVSILLSNRFTASYHQYVHWFWKNKAGFVCIFYMKSNYLMKRGQSS